MREIPRADEARLLPSSSQLAIAAYHRYASTVLPLVESRKIVLPVMVSAHAAYVAAAVLQNIHGGCRCDLVRACLLHLVSVAVAVSAVRHRLVLDAQVHDLREKTVLSAHGELLMVPKAVLVLEVQLVGSLRVGRAESSRA